MSTEFYHCYECAEVECECGQGFYQDEDDETAPECPCCGSTEVQP